MMKFRKSIFKRKNLPLTLFVAFLCVITGFSWFVTYDNFQLDTEYIYVQTDKLSKEFDEILEVKERKKYIPPMTHPWKLSSFKKQVQKSHYKHQYA